jgi:hypothetical protein
MKAWSNIETLSHDPEIIQIDQFEKKLGILPDKVLIIRELITRFEVCHFKYQKHLRKIKDSILTLEPETDPLKIGMNHIQKGENAWKEDKTGRSKTGQQYLWAIRKWLDDRPQTEIYVHFDHQLGQAIETWLGDKNPEKTRLVRLLAARLTWDWKAYEELQMGEAHKDLNMQVCRMDICHYTFPANLNLLLQAIGVMKPAESFEGCGSFNNMIRSYAEKELLLLNEQLQSYMDKSRSDKEEMMRAWLYACLIKTIREQVHLSRPVIKLV